MNLLSNSILDESALNDNPINNGRTLTTQAIWFRNDLRVYDNPALHQAMSVSATRQALENTRTIAVFCVFHKQWQHHDMAQCKQFFIKESLFALKLSLIELRVPLVVLDCPNFADAAKVLSAFCRKYGIHHLFANKEYEFNERQRDHHVAQKLAQQGIHSHWFDDQCILPPGSVLKADQTAYCVFTPFSKRWKEYAYQQGTPTLTVPTPQPAFECETPEWPDCLQQLLPVPANHYFEGGEASAQRRLSAFLKEGIEGYHLERDRPDLDVTSQLSAHLSIGTVSARDCLNRALEYQYGDLFAAQRGSSVWINELIWRDFYRHLLIHFPKLCQHRPFKDETEQVPWRNDAQAFNAWCQGKTGFPIVDAGMRQLQERGWMHNRVRMITAMFLTKHLLIDWRKGEQWFMQHLIDGDLASNNGGWQWSASTGTDAVPYFRIFNPITQSKKCDPEGDYIRRYVPELASLDQDSIHNPTALERQRLNYPEPMVDLSQARERALAAFKIASGNARTRKALTRKERTKKAQNSKTV